MGMFDDVRRRRLLDRRPEPERERTRVVVLPIRDRIPPVPQPVPVAPVPQRGNREWIKPRRNESEMTVCIAAISVPLNVIVTVSDTMLSNDTESTDGAMAKFFPIAKRWGCLFAGNPTAAEELTNHIRTSFGGIKPQSSPPSYPEMIASVENAYRAMFDHRTDVEVLSSLGLNRQMYEELMRTYGPESCRPITDEIHQLANDIQRYDPTELLVCGFDSNFQPCLFSSDAVGHCTLHTGLGYHAIGAGAPAAMAWLNAHLPAPSRSADTAEITYRLCEAKFAAETARSAGPRTFVMAWTDGGIVDFMILLPDDKGDVIRKEWLARIKRPIGKRALANIEKRMPSVTDAVRKHQEFMASMRRQANAEKTEKNE